MTDYLLLVNKTHPLPDGYFDTVTFDEIENLDGGTYKIEAGTKKAYLRLRDALLSEGITVGVDSCFRTLETQRQIMESFIRKFGADYAARTVAPVGTSEHHTGLALDIVPFVRGAWVRQNADLIEEREIFAVIHRALPAFGFILRYPLGKESITGYSYEPWHIRFVGEKAAEITQSGLCFEEYLSLTK